MAELVFPVAVFDRLEDLETRQVVQDVWRGVEMGLAEGETPSSLKRATIRQLQKSRLEVE